jgi:predicted exporter
MTHAIIYAAIATLATLGLPTMAAIALFEALGRKVGPE